MTKRKAKARKKRQRESRRKEAAPSPFLSRVSEIFYRLCKIKVKVV
uniref:Uncharacterized protein n=1 Tax=Podoviridae sp. ctn7K25 TaxID=2825273 RepID=A0A8S5QC76_9CAUD|nr:MAG TPA: hypothetical protein [Podoviridae sp. ctn7K25]